MVQLSEEVAEQLREHYGEDVLNEYRELTPQEIREGESSYNDLEEVYQRTHPEDVDGFVRDHGLAGAIEVIDETAEEWRQEALAWAVEVAIDYEVNDFMDDMELE